MNTETLRSYARRAMVLGTVACALVGSAGVAMAQSSGGTVQSSVTPQPINTAVAIVAIIVGVGGLVVGLWRRRRADAAKAKAVPLPAPRQPMPVTVHQD